MAQLMRSPSASFSVCPEPVDHGRILRFLATLRFPPWVVLVAILGYLRMTSDGPDVQPMRSVYLFLDAPLAQALSAWIVLMVPVGMPVLYFVGGLLAHIGIALTGGAPRSIGATMRAVGYSLGPALLALGILDVPLYLGHLSSTIYLAVLGAVALLFVIQSGIAIARTHEIALARGFLVALVPLIVLVSVSIGRASLELTTLPFLPQPDVPYYVP
jgi:hypothetical protein